MIVTEHQTGTMNWRFGPRFFAYALLAAVSLALAPGITMTAHAADEQGSAPAAEAPEARAANAHHAPRSGVAKRVQLVTKELGLDSHQQAQLLIILEAQRADVAKAWSDSSVPAAIRVGATQAIGEKTADRIRAMLNDEQRKKFSPPKPAHDPRADVDKRSVEDWINMTNSATQGKKKEN